MAKIKFITDSAADLPRTLWEPLGIQVLPFPIATEAGELQDGLDFTPQEFYDTLLSTTQIPTHAQLTPFLFLQCFEAAWQEGYHDVIYTSINSKGSATHHNALQAREEFFHQHPEGADAFHIHIIDSKNYTMSYGWPVAEGAKMAAAGAGAEEIVAYIQNWVTHARVVFVPLDLRFAKKSGRVSAAAAFVGEALGLKPMMSFENGESKMLAKIRGEKHALTALVELCKQERKPGTPYCMVRGCNAEQGDKLLQQCKQELDAPPALEYYVGGVIAINAGPNLIGLVYQSQ